MEHDKKALKSKKFLAFLLVELGYFILMVLIAMKSELSSLGNNFVFVFMVGTSGFLAVGYILGQASLDKYIRLATKLKGGGGSEEVKNG